MVIFLIEPFYTASHKQWADGLARHSRHDVRMITMPGFHWKWRMHGGAVTLADKINTLDYVPDLLLCTDMVDVTSFKSLLTKRYRDIPVILYMHENQITYPWSDGDQDVKLKRDNHYGWINYTSCLAADGVVFNSHYHRKAYVSALPSFLSQFPDYNTSDLIPSIEEKSSVLHLGIDPINYTPKTDTTPHILWNHRWEYDKNPEDFFKTLYRLDEEAVDFHVSVVGQSYPRSPKIFAEAKERLTPHIKNWGYLPQKSDYVKVLQEAHIIPVTSKQDFFGIALIEAMSAGCIPLVPDRLVFPEHITSDFQDMIYRDKESLYQKLKTLCSHVGRLPHPTISTSVKKYDWKSMIAQYDAYFDRFR